MADSNTTNPFNPDPEGENPPTPEGTQPASPRGQNPAETGQTPPPVAPSEKLKLKKTTRILTPLYARPKETPSIGKKKLKIEVPHAVAVDPEPEPEISTTSIREEIGDPSGEGIPPPILPPAEVQAPVPPPQTKPDPEGTENQEETSKSEEEPQEEIQTLVAGNPKKSSKRFLALLAVSILLIVAFVYFVIDPLGHQLAPIEPLPEIISSSPAESNEVIQRVNTTEPMALSMSIEGTDLPAYLEALKLRKISISSNPEGIFINNIFYAPGDSLNPELGLVFEEVLSDGSAKQLVLVDSDNTRHFLPF